LSGLDWSEIPLEDFVSTMERQQDGSFNSIAYPHGDGEAQRLMMGLAGSIDGIYERLISDADLDRLEATGRVPAIRDGQRGYEALDTLMLKDLPAILDTFVVLEEEKKAREAEESERKAAQRKERERVRAKERRKLKKLGEW
jgi:hypothetical protein